jgi:predicted secreted hydrolase
MPDSFLPPCTRRSMLTPLASGALLSTLPAAWALPPKGLQFPRDAGAHPEFAIEWWYVTGYANVAGETAAMGFQVTFFRSRVAATQGMQSGLSAKQLVFAHAAITDVGRKKLWHDQRIARWSGQPSGANPADLASARTTDTNVVLRDWYLRRDGADLMAHIAADDFTLDLRLVATQPVLLQGKAGLSRKGPDAKQASYYYSVPQLQAEGSIVLRGQRHALAAGSRAWLDHEWSQSLLDPQAVGWDWIGINLFDGSALTAFQLRDKHGQALWDGGSFRSGTATYAFSRGEVLFKPQRHWRSALSKASYPVEWVVRTPIDLYTVKAVVDNQELDSRQSTGAIYWEGLCEVWDSNNRLVGRGYLEMTGYATALVL